MIFNKIKHIELPQQAQVGEGFSVIMITDGVVPFGQVIIRQHDNGQWIVRDPIKQQNYHYQFQIPAEAYKVGRAYLQIEGCRVADITTANPDDWIKSYHEFDIIAAPEQFVEPAITLNESQQPVIYFGIHKHMHQPYYNATEPGYWDGEKEGIFGDRSGPYTHYIPAAVRQYIEGGLAHAGLSTSWSGSLIEQLNRCAQTGRGKGAFSHWNQELRTLAAAKTALGHPRIDFTAIGYFHPLMPLIPHRDIMGQILWQRDLIEATFGIAASDILFPPETAFHPHMIPALKAAGIRAVIYDSIHHFRACQHYPYAGPQEGMLPPNPADQLNLPVDDWLQLHNIWAPSTISPQLLKPCWLYYTDHQGQTHELIGIPAERYLGNEDARGGYGALQYEGVMGQLYDQLCQTQTYEPQHPPFFVLHSDGDNYGGGADSYYTCNTSRLVQMCQQDRRFQLITIQDYLQRFPVDPQNRVHLEPGSWAGADNGDPQFTKWFSWVDQAYSPDLNSWAILTAFQNAVHTLEDCQPQAQQLQAIKRLLYTAETSCYWYWTGQAVWDQQVTQAVNHGMALIGNQINDIVQARQDKTAPTIFMPWIRPANPGGKDWGSGGLIDAASSATLYTFIYDVCGIARAILHCQYEDGSSQQFELLDQSYYPSQTNPVMIAQYYKRVLPMVKGRIRYFVEAWDQQQNVAYSTVGGIEIM